MRKLYMKQKIFSLGEKFSILSENQEIIYTAEGSFLKLPKTFAVYNQKHQEVAKITKKTISLLPKFYVEINGQEEFVLEKEFSFFKAKYKILSDDVSVQGDWWDMDFEITRQGKVVGAVHKKWLSWADTYEITVHDEAYQDLLVSLVIAIDCVKAADNSGGNS